MKEKEMSKQELINLAYEELYDIKCLATAYEDCCGYCNYGDE